MGFDFKVINQDILNSVKPAVVIGNHQHNFDMIIASEAFTKRIVALGKRQIAYIPFFGTVFWLAGNILISRGKRESSLKSMAKVERYLTQKNLGVVIFPEGHRNMSQKLLDFKKGAFYTAINAQIPLVIFGVSHYARNMNLNKWKPAKVVIKIAGPIETKGLTEKDIPELMIKARSLIEQTISQANEEARY
jgi:1-acyl-sn-glycerol-3-phosphate acyltransferase